MKKLIFLSGIILVFTSVFVFAEDDRDLWRNDVISSLTNGKENKEDDWPMYGRNLQHTFSNPDSRINPKTVSRLLSTWDFPTADAISASPAIVNGAVYVGSWDGYFYALDADTGSLLWKFQVDCQNSVIPVPPQCLAPGEIPPERFAADGGLITSSAAVVNGKIYFAAGKTLYSLKAKDGSLLWKRVICGNPDNDKCASDDNDPTRIFSSPTIFGGLVFIGVDVDGADGYRGGFMALDAKTGEPRWRFEVDPIFDGNGNVVGGLNRGCGNVWTSAAVDAKNKLVYFSTADCKTAALPPYHEAVIAIEANTGKVRWVFRPRQTDTCDLDFAASPNVIDIGENHYLGIGSKDGTYYMLDRLTYNPYGQLKWAKHVVFGGKSGGFFAGAAFDGAHIFSATAIGDFDPTAPAPGPCTSNPNDTVIQNPSMHAFDAVSGDVIWQRNDNQSVAPTTLADDVVFSGFAGLGPLEQLGQLGIPVPPIPQELQAPAVHAYNAKNGQLLFNRQMPGVVNGAVIPVGKMLFVVTGNSFDGQGGGVHAFKLGKR